ncbi:MAG: hypothetical protein WAT46_18340 [Saprospiraceae bacterium]
MVTNTINRSKTIVIVFVILLSCSLTCKKKPIECPQLGIEHAYFKSGVIYTPGFDSIILGGEVELYAHAPRSFFDTVYQKIVTLTTNDLRGYLSIGKTTGNAASPISGAIEHFNFFPEMGSLYKDSLNYTGSQLTFLRSTSWNTSVSDSFRIRIRLVPKIRGTFIVVLGQQASKDSDCAIFRYFLKIANNDQHLYYYQNAVGGPISESNYHFTYCFKVY